MSRKNKELTELIAQEERNLDFYAREKARAKFLEIASYSEGTEGFPESSSFIYGFVLGYREAKNEYLTKEKK